MLLASGGWKPGVLCNSPRCTAQRPQQRMVRASGNLAQGGQALPLESVTASNDGDKPEGVTFRGAPRLRDT